MRPERACNFNTPVTRKNFARFINHSVPTVASVRCPLLLCWLFSPILMASRGKSGAGLRIDIDKVSHGGHGAMGGFALRYCQLGKRLEYGGV
jgi:hypothetical protein